MIVQVHNRPKWHRVRRNVCKIVNAQPWVAYAARICATQDPVRAQKAAHKVPVAVHSRAHLVSAIEFYLLCEISIIINKPCLTPF